MYPRRKKESKENKSIKDKKHRMLINIKITMDKPEICSYTKPISFCGLGVPYSKGWFFGEVGVLQIWRN